MSVVSCMPASNMRRHRIAVAAEHVGVAGAEDDVGGVEHGVELAARDAHHVADDQQRERLRDRLDEVDLALLAHAVDDLGADRLDRVEHALELARRERAGDDAALAGVARVVHVDERAEELHRLGRHVGDRDRALARAEVLRAPADLDHLGVAGRRRRSARSRRVMGLSNDTGVNGSTSRSSANSAMRLVERLAPEVGIDQSSGGGGGHREMS